MNYEFSCFASIIMKIFNIVTFHYLFLYEYIYSFNVLMVYLVEFVLLQFLYIYYARFIC